MACRRYLRADVKGLTLAVGLSLLTFASRAADVAEPLGPEPLPEAVGVVCEILDDPFKLAATAATLPWPSVWLGHFSGGHPYSDGLGHVLIDWRDEKVCFASQATCRAWVRAMRRFYPYPEGYVTCLLLR